MLSLQSPPNNRVTSKSSVSALKQESPGDLAAPAVADFRVELPPRSPVCSRQ